MNYAQIYGFPGRWMQNSCEVASPPFHLALVRAHWVAIGAEKADVNEDSFFRYRQ